MGPDKLKANLARTLQDMKLQTGLVPGKPTGQCHNVVVGTLTDMPITFVTRETLDKQRELERSVGLTTYSVFSLTKRPVAEVIPHVLEQTKIEFDAVSVEGNIKGKNVAHAIAIVPEDGSPPYHIIDSGLPNATKVLGTTEDVAAFVDELFENRTVEVYVVPTEQEKKRRSGNPMGNQSVGIMEDIFIEAPHPIPDQFSHNNSKLSGQFQ